MDLHSVVVREDSWYKLYLIKSIVPIQSRVWKFPNIKVELSVSPLDCQFLLHVFQWSTVECVTIYTYCIILHWIFPKYMSFVVFRFKILILVWFIATPVCFLLLFAWNIFTYLSVSTCVLSTAHSCCCRLGLCHTACEFFLLWPGIEPVPSAVKLLNPNHWTAREFPGSFFWIYSASLCFALRG